LDADFAAGLEVVLFGALVCESALPAAVFDLPPVEPLLSVFEEFEAALEPVVLLIAYSPLYGC
jgi:hypothetical protein